MSATAGSLGLAVQLRGEDRTSVTELQNLLKQTAEVYRSLVQHAKAASIPVPSEAQLGTGVKRGPDELEYDEFAAANATDWDDFKDEGASPIQLAVRSSMVQSCLNVPVTCGYFVFVCLEQFWQ